METVIVSEDLTIGHKIPLLEHINVTIRRGAFIAVLGENGMGKSTFLKTIAADLPVLSGCLKLDGKDLRKWERLQISQKIAAVWTERLNVGLMTVAEFVAFGRYPFTNWMAKMQLDDKMYVRSAMEQCQIDHLQRKDVQELSDGEKQKVMIARAIAQDTEVIVLDEPTTHLDIKNTAEIFHLLKELSQNHGKTVLVSTHKVEIALQISDEIILINEKELMQNTADNLIENGSIEEQFQSRFMQFDREQKRFSWK